MDYFFGLKNFKGQSCLVCCVVKEFTFYASLSNYLDYCYHHKSIYFYCKWPIFWNNFIIPYNLSCFNIHLCKESLSSTLYEWGSDHAPQRLVRVFLQLKIKMEDGPAMLRKEGQAIVQWRSLLANKLKRHHITLIYFWSLMTFFCERKL